MPFPKMQKTPYPPRRWLLSGFADSGKTSFLTQMGAPVLVIDADQRFNEVLDLQPNAYALSTTPEDNVNPAVIAALLKQNMPKSGIKLIAVDSLTAIIQPIINENINAKEDGKIKNLAAGFEQKARAMRTLIDAITPWGTDTLWIIHLEENRDENAQKGIRESLSRTERIRLTRALNMKVQIVSDAKGRRGIKVVWARRGRSGMTLWDESKKWTDMPERIEEAVYGGLSESEQTAIEHNTNQTFPDDATAISWGFDQGAFKAIQHARNAWDEMMREEKPQGLVEASALWIEEVNARLAEKNGYEEKGNPATQPEPDEKGEQSQPAPTSVGPSEFWKLAGEKVTAKRIANKNVQAIFNAYTVGGKTDWAGALKELEAK